MNAMPLFIMRAVIGAVMAVVIARLFRPGAGPLFTVILAVFLVGAAYLLDYYRNR